MDGLYLQLVEGTRVDYSALVPMSYGESVSITESVNPGTFDVHVFAVEGDRIIGIAVRAGVVLVANQTTELTLTMSPLAFGEPSTQSSIGPGDPSPSAISRSIEGIPADFAAYLLAGATEARAKIDALPADAEDASLEIAATATHADSTLTLQASVPPGTALGNETLYYWFATTWPDCAVALTDASPAAPNSLVYDGATLSGVVQGDPGSGYRVEPDASIELDTGGPVLYSTTTGALGDYIFGSVGPATYTARAVPTDTGTWTTYIYSGQSSLNSAGFSSASTTTPYDVALPCSYAITYTGLSLAPGSITTLDFRFTGY